MQEQRQNWRRFNKVLGFLPSKKPSLILLSGDKQIFAGTISGAQKNRSEHFHDVGMCFDHVENAFEQLAHKYNVTASTVIDRSELMQTLAQVAGSQVTESYHGQLEMIRRALGIENGERTKLATHLGDRPVQDFWPKENFLLRIFQAMFVELLPERKILLLAIVKSETERDLLALEFIGAELHTCYVPDTSNLEWYREAIDLFHRDTISRLVLWSENHYMLPTYAFVMSARAWTECCEEQEKSGERGAWKSFQKIKNARDSEREILVEPEPWPLKACLRWNGMR